MSICLYTCVMFGLCVSVYMCGMNYTFMMHVDVNCILAYVYGCFAYMCACVHMCASLYCDICISCMLNCYEFGVDLYFA